jgi:hypothetical protein
MVRNKGCKQPCAPSQAVTLMEGAGRRAERRRQPPMPSAAEKTQCPSLWPKDSTLKRKARVSADQ